VSSSLNIESVGKIRALVSTAVSFKRKQGDLLPRVWIFFFFKKKSFFHDWCLLVEISFFLTLNTSY